MSSFLGCEFYGSVCWRLILLSGVDVFWFSILCISICCGCYSVIMSSMPVLDGEPEEMEIEIEIPLEEVSVSPVLVLLWYVCF